jgi:dTDP-4-dehydrorhamnose 3,5-epimerase-like enzyme
VITITTNDDILFYEFRCFTEKNGNLIPIESNIDVPFPIKRVFYIYNVKDEDVRGQHAHYKTEQVLVCLSGMVQVTCYDGTSYQHYQLDSPRKALFIPAMIWDEQIYYKGSVLCVFANQKYSREDYIFDKDKFKRLKNGN